MHTKLKTIVILGFLVIIIPFFGIPIAWKEWVLALIGVAIVVLAVLLRRGLPHNAPTGERVYVENIHEQHTETSSEL